MSMTDELKKDIILIANKFKNLKEIANNTDKLEQTLLWSPLDELIKASGAKPVMFGYDFTQQALDTFKQSCNYDFLKESLNKAIDNADRAANSIVIVNDDIFQRIYDIENKEFARQFSANLDKCMTEILDFMKEHKGNQFQLLVRDADDMVKALKQYNDNNHAHFDDFKNVITNTLIMGDDNQTLNIEREVHINLPLNELLEQINKGTIENEKDLLNYHLNKQSTQQRSLDELKDFQKDLQVISKQIKDYERQKSVLLPDAKVRIPQEIANKLEKIRINYATSAITSQQLDTYFAQNPNIAQNITKFQQNYLTQSKSQGKGRSA